MTSYRFEIASMYRDMIQGFLHLKNNISRYHYLTTRDIFLKIPIINGHKLFFISHGQIIFSQSYPLLSSQNIQEFLHQGRAQKLSYPKDIINEKAEIDFRDILYSEITSLPEDMVEVFD